MAKAMIPLEQFLWVVRIAFMILVIGATISLVRYYMNVQTETTALETGMLARGISSIPGFAYQDKHTGRVYPAVITPQTIKNSALLEEKIHYPRNTMAARIDLQNRRGENVGMPAFYHEKDFNTWFPQAEATWTGVDSQEFHMPQDFGQTLITVVKK